MIRIQSVFTGLPGLPGVSSIYFRGASEAQAIDAAAAVNELWLNLQANIVNAITVDVDNVAVAIDEATGEAEAFYTVAGETFLGDRADEPVPLSTQLNLGFRTASVVAGRRVQGRIYVPGLGEQDNVSGAVAPLLQQTFAAAAATALGGQPAGSEHVVWSRPVDGGRPGTVHNVTAYAVNPQWAVLRSRRPN